MDKWFLGQLKELAEETTESLAAENKARGISKVVFKNSSVGKLIEINLIIENFLDEMQLVIKENYNSFMVRLIIAATIETIYSPAERAEYLYEYFNGDLN